MHEKTKESNSLVHASGPRDKVGENFTEKSTVVHEKQVGEMKKAAFGLRWIGLLTNAAVLALAGGFVSWHVTKFVKVNLLSTTIVTII